MIVDHNLAALNDVDLRWAWADSFCLARLLSIHAPVAAIVARSLEASLYAERDARECGRGRGTVRCHIDALEDEDPDQAMTGRGVAIGYLAKLRDGRGQPDAVRVLFADVMDALADPTPTARQVELARFDRMARPR